MKTEVMQFLDERGVNYVVKEHARPVFTCEDAAEQRHVRVSQIVKCMVGSSSAGEIVVMLLPGDRTLKSSKARKHLKLSDLQLLSPADLENSLKVTVGAISPTQFVGRASILVDPTVLNEEYVDISSGDPLAGIELTAKDLLSCLDAEVVDIISTS